MYKKLTAILLCLLFLLPSTVVPVFAESGIEINAANFPDANFREYLKFFHDLNYDGILSQAECDKIKGIDIPMKDLKSLKGIEHFKNLEVLVVPHNKIAEIDLTQNKKLKEVDVSKNNLKTLDLSENKELLKLKAGSNRELLDINFGAINKLKKINLADSMITEFNAQQFPSLSFLDVRRTDNLKKLDLSKNNELEELVCAYSNLEELNLENITKLKELSCSSCNNLKKLKLDGASGLESINLLFNDLQEIDLSDQINLQFLHVEDFKGSKLDLSNNKKLFEVSCGNSELQELKLGELEKLNYLRCDGNNIRSIDISGCKELRQLDCAQNNLSELDLSQNESLETLICSCNNISKIDLPDNVSYIDCSGNNISELDFSNNRLNYFQLLDCSENYMKSLKLPKDFWNQVQIGDLKIKNNQLTYFEQSTIEPQPDAKEMTDKIKDNLQQKVLFEFSSKEEIDLSKEIKDFDLSKTRNWQGGSVDEKNILKLDEGSNKVSYEYIINEKTFIPVTLYFDVEYKNIELQFDTEGHSGELLIRKRPFDYWHPNMKLKYPVQKNESEHIYDYFDEEFKQIEKDGQVLDHFKLLATDIEDGSIYKLRFVDADKYYEDYYVSIILEYDQNSEIEGLAYVNNKKIDPVNNRISCEKLYSLYAAIPDESWLRNLPRAEFRIFDQALKYEDYNSELDGQTLKLRFLDDRSYFPYSFYDCSGLFARYYDIDKETLRPYDDPEEEFKIPDCPECGKTTELFKYETISKRGFITREEIENFKFKQTIRFIPVCDGEKPEYFTIPFNIDGKNKEVLAFKNKTFTKDDLPEALSIADKNHTGWKVNGKGKKYSDNELAKHIDDLIQNNQAKLADEIYYAVFDGTSPSDDDSDDNNDDNNNTYQDKFLYLDIDRGADKSDILAFKKSDKESIKNVEIPAPVAKEGYKAGYKITSDKANKDKIYYKSDKEALIARIIELAFDSDMADKDQTIVLKSVYQEDEQNSPDDGNQDLNKAPFKISFDSEGSEYYEFKAGEKVDFSKIKLPDSDKEEDFEGWQIKGVDGVDEKYKTAEELIKKLEELYKAGKLSGDISITAVYKSKEPGGNSNNSDNDNNLDNDNNSDGNNADKQPSKKKAVYYRPGKLFADDDMRPRLPANIFNPAGTVYPNLVHQQAPVQQNAELPSIPETGERNTAAVVITLMALAAAAAIIRKRA